MAHPVHTSAAFKRIYLLRLMVKTLRLMLSTLRLMVKTLRLMVISI